MSGCDDRAARWPEWPWARPVRLVSAEGETCYACRVCMAVSAPDGVRTWQTEAQVMLHTGLVHRQVLG